MCWVSRTFRVFVARYVTELGVQDIDTYFTTLRRRSSWFQAGVSKTSNNKDALGYGGGGSDGSALGDTIHGGDGIKSLSERKRDAGLMLT